jgi:hypothetical protein
MLEGEEARHIDPEKRSGLYIVRGNIVSKGSDTPNTRGHLSAEALILL